jgi:quercetin dioxygenase-like cupin family protein
VGVASRGRRSRGPCGRLADRWTARFGRSGGDAAGPWQREPVGAGALAGIVTLGPGEYSDPANWHATNTIDVDVILSGQVELALRDVPPVALGPGDIVVQRGVEHRWQPVGDEPLRMATLMIDVA